MANDTRTIREIRARNYDEQPLCITYPPLGVNANFELKGLFIHNLPKFHGHAGNDPNRHLSEFHMMCEGAIPNGVTEDQLKLWAFPFSLLDAAKDWLFHLTPGSIRTLKEMKAAFLEKFYSDSRHNRAKKDITTIEQDPNGETMYEYWERFKKLVAQCPYHGLSDDDLLVNFYEGLGQDDQRMVNSATGGGLENFSIVDGKEIIEKLASTTRNYGRSQRGTRNTSSMRTSSSSTQNLEQSVNDLTHLVKNMMVNNPNKDGGQMNRVECNYCQGPHLEEACPIMIEEGIGVENVSAMGYGNYNARNPFGGGYYNYDPSGNT
ncbi:uncharacterized protein LOC141630277 [Silene latifolia]|uniref:uncharacterized protein LOC141630277 n=1 Tax=Silene latifolia TaxID=37657 RepID=UPI003D787F5C